MKDKFLSILKQVNRPEIDELIIFIDTTDFYTSPASTSYHGSHQGGLVAHSIAVYENLVKINDAYNLKLDSDSMILCGLLHDLCKANTYRKKFRNRLNDENGQWEKAAYYEIYDELPLGHGEKSVVLIQQFIKLSHEEMLAIRWHMGGFDNSAQGYSGTKTLSNAMQKYSIVPALHIADLAATYFDNK